jgi:hypothetical protein
LARFLVPFFAARAASIAAFMSAMSRDSSTYFIAEKSAQLEKHINVPKPRWYYAGHGKYATRKETHA